MLLGLMGKRGNEKKKKKKKKKRALGLRVLMEVLERRMMRVWGEERLPKIGEKMRESVSVVMLVVMGVLTLVFRLKTRLVA